MAELVRYDEAGGVATVTMNRPERLNTMTDGFLEELLERLERAAEAPEVRAVVLQGAGRAFCAGGDPKEGIGGGVGGAGPVTTATGILRRYMRTAQLLRTCPSRRSPRCTAPAPVPDCPWPAPPTYAWPAGQLCSPPPS
ncbi:MAG: enoyl-CoA hydratase/isomerase family protein [Micromonosporaceae bacterium]